MTGADQERADFKKYLFDILIRHHSQTIEMGQPNSHVVTMCIPECTTTEEAASFFYSMICKYRASHFPEDKILMFTPESIMIGYDGVYQCLQVGIMIYEG